jgi:hypothetical protein
VLSPTEESNRFASVGYPTQRNVKPLTPPCSECMALMENGERLKVVAVARRFCLQWTLLLANVVAMYPGIFLKPILRFKKDVLVVLASDHSHTLRHFL